MYAAISSTAWPVFASDTALQRGCFLSSPLRFAHCSMGTQRPPFCSLCVETSGPSPPPAGFRQELDWVLSYKHEVVVAQTSACPGSTGVSGHMHSSSPKIQREREGWCVVRGARAAALLHFPADSLLKSQTPHCSVSEESSVSQNEPLVS